MNNQRKRNNVKRTNRPARKTLRQGQGISGRPGDYDLPPQVKGSQQPSNAIMTRARTERRTIVGYYDVMSSAGGIVSFNISPCYPQSANPAYTGVPTITGMQGLWDEYKITRVGLNYDPIAARSTALAPLYVAYRPMDTLAYSPSLSQILDVVNHAQWDSALAAAFTYKVKMPQTLTGTLAVAGNEILNPGWLDTALLSSASAGVGPGAIAIYGTGFTVSTLIGRLMVSFDLRLRSSA